jgi:hypothetical protein
MDPEATELELTPCARRCLALAQIIASRDHIFVDIDLLMMCVVLGSECASRAQLVVKGVGGIMRFPDHSRAVLDRAVAYIGRDELTAPLAPEVAAALERLPYWVRRTGDEDADSVHLLLALLEAIQFGTAGTEMITVAGVNVRDVIRSAMGTREFVSASDRQRGNCRPILSATRSERPMPYQFRDRRAAAPLLKLRNYKWRAWTTGSEHVNSFLQRRLAQSQVWLIMLLSAVHLALWAAVIYATLRIDYRAALGLLALMTSVKNVPLFVSLTADACLIALWSVWGLPLWIPLIGVAYHAIEIVESRVAVLLVRADTADPSVSVKDLRSDMRTNVGTSYLRKVLK